ncbi:MAG: hypothetical protein J1E61_08710 [Lachnospiraceae bacterium]|nr:hypothetical protein [Lachnospiraceae bacterium]
MKEKRLHGRKFVFMALCLCLLWGCAQKAESGQKETGGVEAEPDIPALGMILSDRERKINLKDHSIKEAIYVDAVKKYAIISGRNYETTFSTLTTEKLMKWADGKGGLPFRYDLETNPHTGRQYCLDQLPLDAEKKEHVICLNICDRDICDYIEVEAYSCDEERNINLYCMILDRENTLLIYQKEFVSKLATMDELRDAIQHGFSDVVTYYLDGPRIGIVDSYEELEQLYVGEKRVYLVQENEIIEVSQKDYWVEAEASSNHVHGERLEDEIVLEENAKIKWSFHPFEIKEIAFRTQINAEIKREMEKELKRCIDQSQAYLDARTPEDLAEEHIWTMDIFVDAKLIYQDENYLGVAIISEYRDLWDGVGKHTPYGDYYIITFDLKTGKQIKLETYIGSDYEDKDLEEIAWIGYQKLMEEAPDKYSRYAFELYYSSYFREEYDHGLIEFSNMRKCYYFTEEGIVFYYDDDIISIPAEYHLDEHLLWGSTVEVLVTYEELENYKQIKSRRSPNILKNIKTATISDGTYAVTLEADYNEMGYGDWDLSPNSRGYYKFPYITRVWIKGGLYEIFPYYNDDIIVYTGAYSERNGDYFGYHEYVREILLLSPRFQTADGIRVGMSLDDLRKRYGDKLAKDVQGYGVGSYGLRYTDGDVEFLFRMDFDDTILEIALWAKEEENTSDSVNERQDESIGDSVEPVVVSSNSKGILCILTEKLYDDITEKSLSSTTEIIGLEKNEAVYKDLHLEQLALQEDEQILCIYVCDLGFCDDTELKVITCKGLQTTTYYMILNRQNDVLFMQQKSVNTLSDRKELISDIQGMLTRDIVFSGPPEDMKLRGEEE